MIVDRAHHTQLKTKNANVMTIKQLSISTIKHASARVRVPLWLMVSALATIHYIHNKIILAIVTVCMAHITTTILFVSVMIIIASLMLSNNNVFAMIRNIPYHNMDIAAAHQMLIMMIITNVNVIT